MATDRNHRREQIVGEVRRWVEGMVIALDLCPFARWPFDAGRVRIAVSEARDEESLLADLQAELKHLDEHRPEKLETSLLVVSRMLQDFFDYNDFLDQADALLDTFGWTGRYQIASFHPDYRFAGTGPDAAENYSNRAPWPVLHILREDSLEEAVARHPDPAGIPDRNIELLNRMGAAALKERLASLKKE